MGAMNSVELLIDDKAMGYAKVYASLLKEEYQRKRAYASIAALFALVDVLEKTSLSVQKSMTLFRNPVLNEEYEISDLYVNDWHLDVRVVTGGNAVLVPKIHYDSDIVPDFYVVIKVDAELKTTELLGFADNSTVQKEAFDYNYFSIPFSSLISYDAFLEKVKEKKTVNLSKEDHDFFLENYLGVVDNEVSLQIKNKVLKHLFACPECRTEFCCFTGFEMVSCNCVKYPEILADQTLEIIGAQNLDAEKYVGKEEIINITDDEIEPLSENEHKEETVSDILDELFNLEEDFIEDSDVSKEKSFSDDIHPVSIADSSDIEIIDDLETSVDAQPSIKHTEELEIINDSIFEDSVETPEKSEIEMIYEDEDEILSDNSSADLEVITEENIEEIVDEDSSSQGNVQKVIVDYDEVGEPIYSYITNVNHDEISTIDGDMELIEDDVDSEEEEYEKIDSDESEELEELESEEIDLLEEKEDFLPENDVVEDSSEKDIEQELDETIEVENDSENALEENLDTMEEIDDEEQTQVDVSDMDDNLEDTDVEDEFEEYDDSSEEIELESDDTEETYDTEEAEESEELDESDDEEYEEYQDDDEFDDYEATEDENVVKGSSKLPLIMVSILVLLGLIGGGVFWFLKNNKDNSSAGTTDALTENNAIEIPKTEPANDMFEQPIDSGIEVPTNENVDIQVPEQPVQQQAQIPVETTAPVENQMPALPETGVIPVPELTENDLVKPQEKSSNGDVNKAITNAFASKGGGASFKGLNWFCTSSLFSDKTFKDYLQSIDNSLKQNLKNNILNAVETPQKNTVSAKFAIDNNGNLKKVIISESSGSTEIDNIVLQSINESFVGEKSQILNDSALKAEMYYLKVVIKL